MSNRYLAGPPALERRLALALTIVGLQIVAAVYFVVDAIVDWRAAPQADPTLQNVMELVVALALLGGIVFGARQTRALLADIHRRENALAIARGALSDFVALRFGEWRLSRAEADVAFFALKGCSIAEIADLRGAAAGTVRAQLSQIYAKAGVTSQSMLIASFIEDLLTDAPVASA